MSASPDIYDLLAEYEALSAEPDAWREIARPDQLTPPGDWQVWLICAGRGWGKTRTAAEDVKAYGLANPNSRIGIIAPTYQDVRDTCVEGESGLHTILPTDEVRAYNRSLGELVLRNDTRYKMFSADDPRRLRGPQHHRLWGDELSAWQYLETYDMAMFGLRLGACPQAVITFTPRPIALIRQLLGDPANVVTRGTTYDNAANLARPFLDKIIKRYEGTRLGRQELGGEILDDIEGALWTRKMIDDGRVDRAPDLVRVVVPIDPAVTAGEDSDETGMVPVGKGVDGDFYVLDDLSCRLSPDGWATRAVDAFDRLEADRIVGEANNGGDLVEAVIQNAASARKRRIAYTKVHASRGKRTRAEPVAALYEQGRVHHVGSFPALEDQLCGWVPGASDSPDRMDSLVWGITALSPDAAPPPRFGVFSLGG